MNTKGMARCESGRQKQVCRISVLGSCDQPLKTDPPPTSDFLGLTSPKS